MKRLIAIIVLVLLGVVILSSLTFQYGEFGERVSDYYLKYGVEQTGAMNIVTAIYLNYRAFDTLGEATVFFATALGVFMLLHKENEDVK